MYNGPLDYKRLCRDMIRQSQAAINLLTEIKLTCEELYVDVLIKEKEGLEDEISYTGYHFKDPAEEMEE